VVYYGAAVMLFCRVAVNFKTAALQHRNTKNGTLLLANQDFDFRIYFLEGERNAYLRISLSKM